MQERSALSYRCETSDFQEPVLGPSRSTKRLKAGSYSPETLLMNHLCELKMYKAHRMIVHIHPQPTVVTVTLLLSALVLIKQIKKVHMFCCYLVCADR